MNLFGNSGKSKFGILGRGSRVSSPGKLIGACPFADSLGRPASCARPLARARRRLSRCPLVTARAAAVTRAATRAAADLLFLFCSVL
jgi:hypothetical protein